MLIKRNIRTLCYLEWPDAIFCVRHPLLRFFSIVLLSLPSKYRSIDHPQIIKTFLQTVHVMSMSSGALDLAIKYLLLNDPRCINDSCLAFQAAHNLSQAQVSYYLQYEYGHWVAWYYSAILGIGVLVRLSFLYRAPHRQPASVSPRPSLIDKTQAIRRYLSYRRFHGTLGNRLGLPSFGILAFLLLGVLFLFVLTFVVRPYYRQHRGYGSPPLAVRTGWASASLTPLLVALSGKASMVTLLTGLGPEKLNVFHRWFGWSVFGLSVVHTVPFIVAPLHDEGYSALHKQFYKPGSFEVKEDLIFSKLWLLILG